MLSNRLKKRFRHLKKWALRTGVDAFRLYDKDIPEIPLVLDFYGDCNLLHDTAVSGALYKRPYEKDQTDEELWLSAMKMSIAEALGVSIERVFLKQRQRQRGASQYEKVSDERFEKIVSEGGFLTGKPLANKLFFKVNLTDYLDTGLFLDRRLLRAIVRDEAADKKVLNLFSYTGSFSVYAAAGGAVSTDSVDLSNTYLNWARENFSLNGFSAGFSKSAHGGKEEEEHRITRINANKNEEDHRMSRKCANRLIRADVLEFLQRAVFDKKKWDIIIVDPPAFSNSKKMIGSFDLNKDLPEMLCQCLKLLAPEGKIFLSINLQHSAPDVAELEAEVNAQLQEQSGNLKAANVRVTDLGNKIVDEDFKGRKMPKAFVIKFDTCSSD